MLPRQRRDAEAVLFVDGVRRIDARVWIETATARGICASYAAGAVRCDGRAEVVDIAVARGMFSTAPTAADIVTRHATYPARMAASNDIAGLMLAVHERMTEVEVGDRRATVDGARSRRHRRTVAGPGHTSTTRSASSRATPCAYLPDELHRIVGTLGRRAADAGVHRRRRRGAGTRGTCGFRVRRDRRGRASCAASARPTSRPAAAIALADTTAAVLPRFASEPHKDTRAPQNLYPIGGLERELRHRLGDQALLYRSLRVAAATAG